MAADWKIEWNCHVLMRGREVVAVISSSQRVDNAWAWFTVNGHHGITAQGAILREAERQAEAALEATDAR